MTDQERIKELEAENAKLKADYDVAILALEMAFQERDDARYWAIQLKQEVARLEAENARLREKLQDSQSCYKTTLEYATLRAATIRSLEDEHRKMEAENNRLRNELKIVYASLDVETNDRDGWKQEARDMLRKFEVALDERDEARYWAIHHKSEATRWQAWYQEVKRNLVAQSKRHDKLEYLSWLPAGDPDSIPF